MATYRLDTDVSGELIFVEEENGSFQSPAARPPWERDGDLSDPCGQQKSSCRIRFPAC